MGWGFGVASGLAPGTYLGGRKPQPHLLLDPRPARLRLGS